jgi:2,4-diketo-3-deoxy-L-fuconate hydrolase
MKLLRSRSYDDGQTIRTGVLVDGIRYDTSELGEDYDENFFATGGIDRLRKFVQERFPNLPLIPAADRALSPVCRPSKIVCVGLNYADHATETGQSKPIEPVLFLKSTTALTGPFDDIILPLDSVKTDWEVELAVIIGKKASYVDESKAMEYVAGYTVHNDVSERAYQLERGGTWDKGKGCDTFAPMGPWLVTADEIRNPNQLGLWLKVNGAVKQNSSTKQLVFSIPFLISYISRFMTLLPGDIISTGTPAGVGMGFNPPEYLKEGDIVELGIDQIGIIRQRVRKYPASLS